MSELYPTPTRIQLLRDVQDGRVLFRGGDSWCEWQVEGRHPTKVTFTVKQVAAAGWIQRQPATPFRWDLTDAGRQILGGAS